MTTNYLEKYGPALIDQGYDIVPIAKGFKHPKGLAGWQKLHATHKTQREWVRSGYPGVGIQARHCVGVDLDIYDEEVCKKMKDFVIDVLGPSLVRVGLPPKVLLPYRTITPFHKVQSQRFISPDWHIHKVEMLGEGQQWVAYHDHPDTGKPYAWYWNDKPCEGIVKVRFDTLPTITEIQSKKIVTGFNTLMASVGWKIFVENEAIASAVRQGHEKDEVMKALRNGTLHELKHKNVLEGVSGSVLGGDDWLDSPVPGISGTTSNGGDPIIALRSNGGDPCNDNSGLHDGDSGLHDGDSFAYLKPKLDISWEEMIAALKEIASDDYEIWIRVGMALWHQTDGSPEGQALWDQWSSTASNYSPDLVDEKWSGFSDAGSRDPVTFATVLKMARTARTARNPLAEFLKCYVYVQDGDCVVDLDRAPNATPMEMKSFRNLTANIRMEIEVPAPTVADPDRVKKKIVPVHNVWLSHGARKSAVGFCYEPGKGRFVPTGFRDDVEVNTFYMKEHAVVADVDLSVFHRHMKYLFPVDSEREWFIDWMAYGIQKPNKRCKVTPLHISVDHGTGRGWIVKMIEELVGFWNCSRTKMSTIMAEGGYNEYMHKSIFCFIEEIHEGDRRYGISDKARDVLTEDRMEVNVKYGFKGTINVYPNFMLMSNHTDALVLKVEDRRVAVFRCDEAFKPDEYYAMLYKWKDDARNQSALFHWLMTRDISGFRAQRAPQTAAKDDMIGFNRSGIEEAFFDFREEHPDINAIKIGRLMEYFNIGRAFGNEFGVKDEKQLVKILQQNATHSGGRKRLGGEAKTIWYLGRRGTVSDDQARRGLKILEDITEKKKSACRCVGETAKDWLD